ncbi:MAG: PHP domain-containing protein [Anaerolineae bacterium]|nr:PHP domain-containing protein [Anaerolineae bacterium]
MDQRGIDRLAITDHNTAEGALQMQQLAPERIIVGEEIMTNQGELLGYFMQESIPEGLSPDETLRRLRDQGAVISVSHPFDRLRKGAWQEAELLKIIDRVDAIETFNSRCIFTEDNLKAAQFAQRYGLMRTVGSDAHSRPEYGRATLLMEAFDGPVAFIAALGSAQADQRYSPVWVHANSKTAKWSKKLGLRRRLWEGG